MACNIETVAYPTWWATANTFQVSIDGGGVYNVAKADVEFLPQGLALIGPDAGHPTVVAPWHTVGAIKVTG